MMAYGLVEVQTLEVGGIHYSEYRYEPELEDEQEAEVENTQYITAIKDPAEKSINHYLVTLLNRFTGKEQRVDLILQETGFMAMVTEIRKHFGYGWEIFCWSDCDAPF